MEQEVVKLEYYGRNSSGLALSGMAHFRDGKLWKWIRSGEDPKEFWFDIDSGIPSQWSVGNYGRLVRYPKRITALKKKLQQENEF